jgi:ABC-type Na+ efflux pump permease subunit
MIRPLPHLSARSARAGIQGFMSGMMLFGVLVISGIFGSSIVRDFEERTYEMIFTKPITKNAYLGGRLVGSAVVALAVFAVMVPAFLLAPLMPWANRESYMSVHLWYYVQPYLSIVATEVLSLGAIFFMVGALTRNIVAVYLQGIVFLALYLIAGQFVSDLPNSLSAYISGLIDPLAMRTTTIVARYWTVSEKNSQVVAFSGLMAYNRFLWLALGALATAATFRFFPFSVEALVAGRRVGRTAEADAPGASVAVVAEVPRPLQVFRPWTTVAQFWRMTRLRVALVRPACRSWLWC